VFNLALSAKFSVDEALQLVIRQGYQRLLFGEEVVRVDEASERLKSSPTAILNVVQDRIALRDESRARFVDACEQAYHFGQGKLSIWINGRETRFSNRFHCAECDIDYREPSPALFSFNHPTGACPACRGFGRIIAIDYDAAIPDRSLSLAQGAVKPWRTGVSAECQQDMARFATLRKVPMNVPFQDLPKKWQDWVVEGDPGYGSDKDHEWPKAWYGVKGYFRWLESKSYKMHVRVLLSRFRIYRTCPQCHGTRFQAEALAYRLGSPGLNIAEFYQLPLTGALAFIKSLEALRPKTSASDPLTLALSEVRSRLEYLIAAGLGYLSLDRSTRSLSGGETERVSLTTCLGSRLVNTLFVLDEPSVGLHARDTQRLVAILERLRDAGNTVVVVEHEAAVMRAADQIVDLGPGHGESGGQIVFQGTYEEILSAPDSLTGQYLSGRKRIEIPPRRPISEDAALIIQGASAHNLKDLTVRLPLGRFVCLTGVSGSGKTTLLREVLLPALEARLNQAAQTRQNRDAEEEGDDEAPEASASGAVTLLGWEAIGRVALVDQSSLGKTPRSNPAVYIGAFDDIRAVFADCELARQRGLNASAFSFNSAQGQCDRCRGAGFEKIEMQFLSDVFIRCPDCEGRRYRSHILEVTLSSHGREWSIADLLEATVDESIEFLRGFADSRPAHRAVARLELLREVGLGYVRLGQPINTLSGGESQRLKLVSHLAALNGIEPSESEKPTLFLFDEPTTGLHFEDVRVLLAVFQRLVNAGNSVLVIEHNLDVIQSADWVIDMGPEGGEEGGRIVAEGTPELISAVSGSFTGEALRQHNPKRLNPKTK
jgi:excinuclease ABC subunit A